MIRIGYKPIKIIMKTKLRGGLFQKRHFKLDMKILLSLIAVLVLTISHLKAQLPEGFVAKKLTDNVVREGICMAHAPDGRIFIAERGGIVKVLQNGVLTTVHTVATTTANEQGLLGMTLHPNFSTNGKCYIYYTNPSLTFHYLDVIVISSSNTVTSINRLLQFDQIINGFHNGGAMVFKEGLLYICIGESNSQSTAQDVNTYMGKVIRLTDTGLPAPGNPYYNEAGANVQKRSMWAKGMRNPWTMSLDPASGKLFVVNVGGTEEIDEVSAPSAAKNYNYGWGPEGYSGPNQPATTILPYFSYGRDGWGCAVTSGTAFNPPATNYPNRYKNRYYLTDWCGSWLRSFDINNPGSGYEEFAATGFSRILGTSVGIDGNIYWIDYANTGSLYRLEYTLNPTPVVVNQPQSKTVYAQDAVSFSVTVTGTPPFTYQWRKDGVAISGATSNVYSIASTTTANAGNYTCVINNDNGSVTTTVASLTVLPYNAIPVATISTPATTLKWSVGDVINFSGNATDAEDGTLPASAFHWEVQLYHKDCESCEHWHPGAAVPSGVKSGSFVADNGGESSHNIWVRLLLTVTDANGRVDKDSVDIFPNKVDITFQTSVPGLKGVLGKEVTAPYTGTFVVNTATTLQAITPQVLNATVYDFVSWAHGGAASQNIRVPAVNTTFTATYNAGTSVQQPFYGTPINIPGRVEAEDFDKGGEGYAYHDNNTQNSGNQYRTAEGVDIENCNEGGYNLGWVGNGEWLEYTLNVTQAGNYNIGFRVGTPYTNRLARLEIDGANISGPINIPQTGGFGAWQTVTVNNIYLALGTKVMRFYVETGDFNFNYINFELGTGGSNILPTASITSPVNNASFAAPANITINANATDADGTIAKVEFFNGTTKLGEDASSPYSYVWSNVAAGTYSITAKAIDNATGTTTSAAVNLTVTGTASSNLALLKPVVASSIENGGTPAPNAVDGVPNSRWASAFADPQWIYVDLGAVYSINRVRILWEAAMAKDYRIELSNDAANWTPVKTVTNNSLAENNWTDIVGSGKFVRIYGTARTTGYGYSIFELEVYGTSGGGGNIAPSVSITSPSNNATFVSPASITINATAADTDGSVTLVEFYNGATKLGEDATSPYSFVWNNVATGSYSITAKATDNASAQTTSAAISVTVNAPANIAPSVSITSPANNAAYVSPASITINATAADTDGNVTLVEFYNGATKLGEDATSPYSFVWNNVAAGTYSITARATDNATAQTTSSAVTVTVTSTSNANLALLKPAFASSLEGANVPASAAVDGVPNTRWSSQFADPQWIYVDLGAVYSINRVKITWEAARGKDFRIELSNDAVNWTPVKTVVGNTLTVNDYTDISGTGKFVRMYGTARHTVYGFSIFELEVYGTPAARQAFVEEPATSTVTWQPNPVNDYLYISTLSDLTPSINVLIVNQNGYVVVDEIYKNETGSFEENINVSTLPAGVYILKVFDGGNVILSESFVKQ
jgi:glucose/arabinose dehydrogenase